MINYENYDMSRQEMVISFLEGAVLSILLFILFYKSIYICLLGAIPGGILFYRRRKGILANRRKKELTWQFRDAMESLISAMTAGYSIEHAVKEARKDLSHMYSENDLIIRELMEMEKRIELRIPIEELLDDLGTRSNVEEIKLFAEVFKTAQKSGGHLLDIMRRTSLSIREKIEIQRQISTLITGKQLEMRCMTAIPLLIIVYLQFSSPDFLSPLYHNPAGEVFMTIALLAYIGSYLLAHRIMSIKI